ncbi:hypothetical protein PENTCL1PPCAC_2972 [Pristionchus entomophagus]|uniref:RING-type domain-containing protein n=1 Tax=Pristionchus entomophagus TaxID=358040 RepID=A0AAV5SDM1_9BILA|nr:hypothetical protein PENTCL1PPCAC_2972 [Pristionchus entomophagus]
MRAREEDCDAIERMLWSLEQFLRPICKYFIILCACERLWTGLKLVGEIMPSCEDAIQVVMFFFQFMGFVILAMASLKISGAFFNALQSHCFPAELKDAQTQTTFHLRQPSKLRKKKEGKNELFPGMNSPPSVAPSSWPCEICGETDPPSRSAFISCGHVTCGGCAKQVSRSACPYCRKKSMTIRLYM